MANQYPYDRFVDPAENQIPGGRHAHTPRPRPADTAGRQPTGWEQPGWEPPASGWDQPAGGQPQVLPVPPARPAPAPAGAEVPRAYRAADEWRTPPDNPWQPTAAEKLWASLRIRAAAEIRTINITHCSRAYEWFGTPDALSPVGVVLFYLLARENRLYTVARHSDTGEGFDTIEELLPGLTATARKFITRARQSKQPWDPRDRTQPLVNWGALDMPREAEFVGCGLETLDTETGRWSDVVRMGPYGDLPGEGFVLLIDGSAIFVRRSRDLPLGDDGVRCNMALNSAYRSFRDPKDFLTQDPRTAPIWAHLGGLHSVLTAYLRPDAVPPDPPARGRR